MYNNQLTGRTDDDAQNRVLNEAQQSRPGGRTDNDR